MMTSFDKLLQTCEELELEQSILEDDWSSSPFRWIRMIVSSRKRGAIGERIVARWLAKIGFHVERCPDSKADRVINGHRVEIKVSTLWDGGIYSFSQIRDQEYEYAILFGMSPSSAHLWIVPKKDARANSPGQHGGEEAIETKWLHVNPLSPPAWLEPFGGDVEVGIERAVEFFSDTMCSRQESWPWGVV